jgi:hypothetical protein
VLRVGTPAFRPGQSTPREATRLVGHPAPPALRPCRTAPGGLAGQAAGSPYRWLRRASHGLPIAVVSAVGTLRPLAKRITVHSSRTRIATSFKCLVGEVVSAPDSRVAGRLNSSVRAHVGASNVVRGRAKRCGPVAASHLPMGDHWRRRLYMLSVRRKSIPRSGSAPNSVSTERKQHLGWAPVQKGQTGPVSRYPPQDGRGREGWRNAAPHAHMQRSVGRRHQSP